MAFALGHGFGGKKGIAFFASMFRLFCMFKRVFLRFSAKRTLPSDVLV